jgi:hypothetical protein
MYVHKLGKAIRLMSLPFAASCAVPQSPVPQPHSSTCFGLSGELSDTLYAQQQLSDASPPVPRPAHLAPYPPSGDGEYRIWFRGETYLASGMPIYVTSTADNESKLVRIGSADQVPVFARDGSSSQVGRVSRLWAPITDTCVFLPFNHESEIR